MIKKYSKSNYIIVLFLIYLLISSNHKIALSQTIISQKDKKHIFTKSKNCTRSQDIELKTNITDFYYDRALNRFASNDLNGAIEDLNKALKIKPNDPILYDQRGVIKFYAKNYKAALDDHNKAIKIDPNYGLAYENRGIVKASLNDKVGALKDYDKAIKIYSCLPIDGYNVLLASTYNNRGYLKASMKQYIEAIKDYDMAIKFNCKDKCALENKKSALKMLKKLK